MVWGDGWWVLNDEWTYPSAWRPWGRHRCRCAGPTRRWPTTSRAGSRHADADNETRRHETEDILACTHGSLHPLLLGLKSLDLHPSNRCVRAQLGASRKQCCIAYRVGERGPRHLDTAHVAFPVVRHRLITRQQAQTRTACCSGLNKLVKLDGRSDSESECSLVPAWGAPCPSWGLAQARPPCCSPSPGRWPLYVRCLRCLIDDAFWSTKEQGQQTC